MPDPRRRQAPDIDPMWGDQTVTIPAPPPMREFNPPPPDDPVVSALLAGHGNRAPSVQREVTQIPAPGGRSEFLPETQPQPGLPPILAGSGYRPQPDPIEITGVHRGLAMPPMELSGGATSQIANRGMPGGGDADKYPEPPPGPQAAQGIPPMLAKPAAGNSAAPRPRAKAAASASPRPPEAVFSAAASDAQESPEFLAYVRQRAQDKAQLAAAQNKADEARKWQDVANGFVRAGDIAAGRKTDEGALQQKLENTGQPVRNVLQQQEAGRAATGEALTQANLSGKLWEQRLATQANDPNSPVSRRTQAFLAGTKLFPPGAERYISAADYEKALQAGSAGIHALTLKAQIAHQNAELEIQRGNAAENVRHHDMEHEAAMFRARPTVPPQQQSDIEALISGARNIYDLENVNKNADWTDKLGSVIGVGNAAQTKKAVAPEIAKANAKGRVNPAGEVRENSVLPGPNTIGGAANTQRRRAQFLADADAKIRVMESDPKLNQDHVAAMRRQYDEEVAREGGAGGTQPTHYLVNKSKGIRIAADANGKPLPGAKPEPIQ